MSTEVKKVLVTGATGYIASHCVKLLLQESYSVRGTVRSLKNEEKLTSLKSLPSFDKIELVEADLLDAESIDKAVAGCSHVLHIASSFPADRSRSEEEIIKPAVEGTKAVMQACLKHKVKRVVVTSSTAAIMGDVERCQNGATLSEEDWAADDTKDAYFKSKMLAEKEAWKFVEALEEKDKFELVVINPTFVQGPTLGRGDATSFVFAKQMLEHQIPFLANLHFGYTDVRDVALAHVRGMTLPDAVGKRHLVNTGGYWVKDVAMMLDKEFASMGYKIPTKVCPSFLLRIYAYFDAFTSMLIPMLDKHVALDNSRMKNVLKIEPIPIEKSISDMAHSLIQNGLVKKTDKYVPKDYL